MAGLDGLGVHGRLIQAAGSQSGIGRVATGTCERKHILRAAHFFRALVARRVFVPKHIAGTENIADLCTKAVSRATFVHLMTRLMPA